MELNLRGNSISDISPLSGLTSLMGAQSAWQSDSDYGPLRRLKAANPDVDIDIDLNNNPPVFTDGDSTTRSVPETLPPGKTSARLSLPLMLTIIPSLIPRWHGCRSVQYCQHIGTTANPCSIDDETKSSYSVTVTVYDGNSGGDRITVTINVTSAPANNAPVFTDGTSTTRSITENTAAGQNIGTAIAATDADTGDTLTYALGGTDAAAFSIVSTSGQLQPVQH